MAVDTKSITGRREVRYESLDEVLADAERLAQGSVKMLGNWSFAQMLGHLAHGLDASIDGFPGNMPWIVKIFAKMFMRKMLLQGPLKPGFKLPPDAEAKMVPPGDTEVQASLAELRRAIQRQKTETHRVPHLALGEISIEDWNRAHLRHAELHMSFADVASE